jgi:hypothetical protein
MTSATGERIHWPDCWKYFIRDTGGGTTYVGGGRLKIDDKKKYVVTYHCPCGAAHTREIGKNIMGTHLWVRMHFPHLPVEDQVDTD